MSQLKPIKPLPKRKDNSKVDEIKSLIENKIKDGDDELGMAYNYILGLPDRKQRRFRLLQLGQMLTDKKRKELYDKKKSIIAKPQSNNEL